jgi:hypothetical protein
MAQQVRSQFGDSGAGAGSIGWQISWTQWANFSQACDSGIGLTATTVESKTDTLLPPDHL